MRAKVPDKEQSSWHLLYKQWFYWCYKVDEDYIKFDTEQAENAKYAERQKKLVFQKNR